jgi:PAS domain S-box-containing protein
VARKGIVSSLAKRKPSSARAEKSVPGKHPPPKKRSRLRQGEPDGSQTPKAATRSASPSPEDAGAGLTVPLALKQTEDAIYVISRVFRAAADPIIIRDMDGTIIDLNAEAERAYGWKRDELIGQSIKQILPPEEHERVDDLVRRCRSGQSVRDVEILRWNKAGKRIPVLLTLSVIENEAGDAVAVATLAKHIVRLKEVENALRRSETRLRRTEKDLRALASELIQDREEENKRWARELHDVFSQTLAVLKIDVATLREQIPYGNRH